MFAVVKVMDWRKKPIIKVFNKTQKELTQYFAKIKQYYELLEFQKTREVALLRAKLLRRNYKVSIPPRNTIGTKLARSKAKLGKNNPMYGPISEERRQKISLSMKGKKNRQGTGDGIEHRLVKSIRARRTNKKKFKGTVWCHNPVTNQLKRVKPGSVPDGFKLGRTPELDEIGAYNLSEARRNKHGSNR